MPFLVIDEGIIVNNLEEKILFKFIKNLNWVQSKQNQINFLSQEINFKRIDQRLEDPIVLTNIKYFETLLQNQVCVDILNAFFKSKQQMEKLLYGMEFLDKQVPTKA